MTYLVVCGVALLASGLTFFSGFGLGTLLLPAFALFFPIERAVALTAVVHFLNGLFKLVLVARHADLGIVARFGLPAFVASFLGAWVLLWLSGAGPILAYSLAGREVSVVPVKLVVGVLLLAFALVEVLPGFRGMAFSPRHLVVGGVLSGFFGGLSGMQGALRSAFLARVDVRKEVFIATGAVVATLVDVSRLSLYWSILASERAHLDVTLLTGAVVCAFAGALLGSRFLHAVTMTGIRRVVTAMLVLVSLGLVSGLL
jgi:uncharacterized membrane protein YfcA